MSSLDPTQLSFVVQGAVARGAFSTRQVCAAIRRWFPGSEIVVSTWRGQDVDGIDADQVVRSEDPGPLPSAHNTNRQLVSSREGVRRASNPLVVKLRSRCPPRSR
jgi:WavE lipopolysaccharide synthesis